jgi:hypothetical protein
MANEMELVGGAATRKKHAILEPHTFEIFGSI